jgi:serine/threonine protein kinase
MSVVSFLRYNHGAELRHVIVGNLRANPPLINHLFESAIEVYKVIEELDIPSTVALTRRCLRLDPTNRASAEELLTDPWFSGVD